MNKVHSYIIIIGFCSLLSCGHSEKNNSVHMVKNVDSLSLFQILPPKKTGISFVNNIQESLHMNGLTYEYLYNGSGVAVGDLNNDGLTDVLFISSLEKNELYINKGDLKFKNTTITSGVQGTYGFATGVTLVDIDYDGKMDIYICKSGIFDDPNKRRNELYINKGNNEIGIPIFEEVASEYGLDFPHQSTQASFFDYDRDGDLDLFLLNHGVDPSYQLEDIPALLKKPSPEQSDRLFRNDNGKFKDVSEEAGIVNNALSFGLGLAIGDLNNDGWPDILVGQDYSEKDHLYINQQNGTFIEVAQTAVNHISNFSMGNDIADYNNDGLLDFITVDMVSESNYDIKTSMSGMAPERFNQLVDYGLHHQYMFNTLQINNGNLDDGNTPAFSDVAQLAGVSNTDWSWGPLFLDMDNDGLKDLFVSNGIKRDFRNNDYVKYKEKRLAQYMKDQKRSKNPKKLLEDYIKDLMGRIPKKNKDNLFFRNNGDLTFSKMNPLWNVNALTSTSGAAYADFDNDGDLDIVTNNVDDFAFIYRNNSIEEKVGNNFVQFALIGPEKNPDGIGTRITIEHEGQKQVVEQYLSRGFQSAVDTKIHFGLGTTNTVDKVEVIWPDGKRHTLTNLKANELYTLNYKGASINSVQKRIVAPVFEDITKKSKIDFVHKENPHNDFFKESLLPHKMSQFGPALAVGDINKDGLDDFYVGGSMGHPGALYLQNNNTTFEKDSTNLDLWYQEKEYEDTAALFFDADGDGDLDLYAVSGGNENTLNSGKLQDRIYKNNGKGKFEKQPRIPKVQTSGGVVKAADFDNDGDLDLFVGGRQTPQMYPFPADSKILRNDSRDKKIAFTDVTKEIAPVLTALGMVTDMSWIDIDGDDDLDIVTTGEWMPITVFHNTNGAFTKAVHTGLENHAGWWNSIKAADFDKDGDIDFIAGNLGLNYKYKASKEEPFEVYANDFDQNGALDIVLGYYDDGNLFPLRGRECSSNQIPIIKEKFPSYDLFAKASLSEVYGEEKIKEALHYAATDFATSYIENKGDGTFKITALPNAAQFSSTNTIEINDFNGDSILDIVLSGNMYGSEVETPRNDAGYGLLLNGNGKGEFKPVSSNMSGLFVKGDVKASRTITLSENRKGILFAKNQDSLQLVKLHK